MTDTRDYLTVRRLHPDNADRELAEKYRAALEEIRRYHINMYGDRASSYIAYDIAAKALEDAG